MSADGIRIMNIMLPIVGFQIAASNLFQSLGMVRKSIILSLSRQLLFLLPCLYLLPMGFEGKGIWMSYPISDGLASLLTIILLSRLLKKFNKLKDGDDPTILGSTI
jgi:Na+-driven multidrug efflux pump